MIATQIVPFDECGAWHQSLETRPPRLMHFTAVFAMLVLMTAGVWLALTRVDLVVRAAGTVRPRENPTHIFTANETGLTGRIAVVVVRPGDKVVAGQLLMQLDTSALDVDVDKEQRKIQAAKRELLQIDQWAKLLETQRSVAVEKTRREKKKAERDWIQVEERRQSELRRAVAEREAAAMDLDRAERLARGMAISQAELEQARIKLQAAEEKQRMAEMPTENHAVAILEQATLLTDQDFAVKLAELETRRLEKQGQLEQSEREISRLTVLCERSKIRAPSTGIVTHGDYKVGDVIELGKSVFELAAQTGFCFEANVRNIDMASLKSNLPARIKLDAYNYQQYGTVGGQVYFIAPDAQAGKASSSSARDANSSSFLVRVELEDNSLQQGQLHGDLRLGLSGNVEIVTDRQSLLTFLLRRLKSSISFVDSPLPKASDSHL